MRARVPAALFSAIAIAAVGCSGGASQPPATPAGDPTAAISAGLKEWEIKLDSNVGLAGTLTFTIKNNGDETHEFVVVKTDLAADKLPVVDDKVSEDAVEAVDEIEDIKPGTTETLVLEGLAPGRYVVICNLLGHYGKGMRADVTVK
ncbi:MAG: sulfocyanin-like copper-binding protein [Chloroflexota bacterium]